MFGFFQQIGKALMLPIAVLPAAALLLRLGQQDLLNIAFIAKSGDAVFANLAIIFAIGVAVGLAKDHHGAAGLAGAIGFFILDNATKAINKDINMGVLGGIIAGVLAGYLYNRFYNIKLPAWLGFFSGKRFVPIITAATMVLIAAVFGFIWPPIQAGINSIGQWIIGAGALGVGVYGFLNRLLIPIGLHHVLNSLVWFVFGSYHGAAGDLNRFFAGDPTAGIFMAGFFPIMMFGLPAATLAMIATAKPERRKMVSGLLIGSAITSFLTGITEPIEFSFMFLSPLLYLVHSLLTASSFAISYLLGIHHGFGFSAGAIDFFLNLGIAQRPWLLLGLGLVYGPIYFGVFYWLIKRFDLKTPGREEEEDLPEDVPVTQTAMLGDKNEEMAYLFLQDLGGKDNIASLDNCATRLRLVVNEMSKVDERGLKKHGARGIMKLNNTNLQVIVGTHVEFVADAMKRQMKENTVVMRDVQEQPTQDCPSPLGSKIDFILPIEGKVIPLSEVPDQVFAEKMMGDGFAIDPMNGRIVSPIEGEVISIFPTKHAIGLRSKEGYEILIHFGLDTVKLDGKGFDALVEEGATVRKGQEMMKVDLDYVKQHAPSIITPVIFTNLPENQKIELNHTGYAKQGAENIFAIASKEAVRV